MVTIVRQPLANGPEAQAAWSAAASAARAWAVGHGTGLRDAILLVPFTSLLAPARAAFMRHGGWMPRIETTQTLANTLGPPATAEAGQLSHDPTLDALNAAQMLRSLPRGAAWAQRDAREFERAVADVTATAQAMARAAAALWPDDRVEHWARARQLLSPASWPGAQERLLARVALEWAALAPTPATDRLFEARPSTWIVVRAGGADALTERLLGRAAAAETPCLVLDTDAAEDAPFDAPTDRPAPAFLLCDGFESEAQCAAAQVLDHLRAGEQPVALVAQDRLLVRRIRALLERHGVTMQDETGWTLSTTRAAAQIVGLLNSARHDASTDEVLDWLKSGTAWPQTPRGSAAIEALEAACRRHQVARAAAITPARLGADTAVWWATAAAPLVEFGRHRRQSLAAWLAALMSALDACGALAMLRADDAGRQVLAALWLDRPAAPGSAWQLGAGSVTFTQDEFAAWARRTLEGADFVAHPPTGQPAQVVITPLARVMLRPFAALVFPGADDRHLGAAGMPPHLLNDTQAAALGVPTAADRRRAELLAFAQALALPNVTLLRRRLDGADPLADSPLLERLAAALERDGRSLAPGRDRRRETHRPRTPIECTAPAAPDLLPDRLSASGLEALRACPYRFFALRVLRLREADELDGEIEKRDFGNWLHAVLHRFHAARAAPAPRAMEIEALTDLAFELQTEHGLDAAQFLPFSASFKTFAPRYVDWLHRRDRNGARWLAGEEAISVQAFDGLTLQGVIDRVDQVDRSDASGDPTEALELFDYKTGSAANLKARVREPLEDTQLAFYAALMRSQTDAPLEAAYLALDSASGIETIEHKSVEQSAAILLDGLAHDIGRLQRGAGLPALGEDLACEHCAARGICRRDHWTRRSPLPAASEVARGDA